MKKTFYRLLLALVVLLLTASPALAAEERSLNLVSIAHIQGKGVVFTFAPEGNFAADELHGTVTVAFQTYNLDCGYNDLGVVKCAADQSLAAHIGQQAVGQVAGYSFTGIIRMAAPDGMYCYEVFQKSAGGWRKLTEACGTDRAQDGDWILIGGKLAFFDSTGPLGAGFYVNSSALGHRPRSNPYN